MPYVNETVMSFLEQRAHLYDGVGFMVVDVDGTSNLSWPIYSLPDRTMEHCDSPEVEAMNDLLWKPDCETRQSILDVGNALNVCAEYTTGWVVLLEDDCTACPGAVDEMIVSLSSLSTVDVSTAKFSKSFSGTAFPSPKIADYVKHILSRRRDRPHDLHDSNLWDGKGNAYTHSRNLLHHIGYVSTALHKNEAEFHTNYDELRADKCFNPLT